MLCKTVQIIRGKRAFKLNFNFQGQYTMYHTAHNLIRHLSFKTVMNKNALNEGKYHLPLTKEIKNLK